MQIVKNREPFVVYHNGVAKSILNQRLVEKQGLTANTVEAIVALHEEKLEVFAGMSTTTDSTTLRTLANVVTNIEFQLQVLWGFERSADFHYWWNVPHCTCPVMDNRERWGTPHSVRNMDCIVHGELK